MLTSQELVDTIINIRRILTYYCAESADVKEYEKCIESIEYLFEEPESGGSAKRLEALHKHISKYLEEQIDIFSDVLIDSRVDMIIILDILKELIYCYRYELNSNKGSFGFGELIYEYLIKLKNHFKLYPQSNLEMMNNKVLDYLDSESEIPKIPASIRPILIREINKTFFYYIDMN